MARIYAGEKTYHRPDCVAHGLPDGPSDEYDVRNTEDGFSAQEVGEHTGEQATEHCAKRC